MIGEDDLRDCFAMFAMNAIVSRGINKDIVEQVAENAYTMADAMLEARKGKTEAGIASIGKRKYVRKNEE
jgi:hypothetical protein